MTIKLEDIHPSGLSKTVWWFWLYDTQGTSGTILYLDVYEELTRDTVRKRNWKTVKRYNRLARQYEQNMPVDEVPFNDTIVERAKRQLMDSITVELWRKE